jgi:hypothetical protein
VFSRLLVYTVNVVVVVATLAVFTTTLPTATAAAPACLAARCLVGRAVAAPLVVVSLRGGLAPPRCGWRLQQLSRRRRLLRCGWRLWQLISDFAAGCSPFDLDYYHFVSMVVNLSEAKGRFCVVWLEKYKLFYLSVSCNTSIKGTQD